ncbi:MAG: YfjI family protein [Hoeflea sp.]|uniref:YfjI family protein n=1 Tax=Hoeflea sp. TaxID=1940281 RepID=UPI003EF8F516
MSAREAFKSAQPFVGVEPTPLIREIQPGDPFPVSALGPLQAVAEAIHDKVQAPVAIGAQSALTVASLAVQAFADVETLAGYSPVSLFGLTVAKSGERKSSSDRLLIEPIHGFQKGLAEKYRDELTDYKIDLSIWETRHRDILKTAKSDADGTRADLLALGPEPATPLLPVMLAGDPTLEGLLKLYASGRPSLGLFTDEGGGFVGGHAMSKDHRLKSVSGLSKLWDGSGVDRVRAGDGAEAFYGIRLACHVLLQPVAAMGLLADPVANGQGFLARFLMSHPASEIGFRLRTEYDSNSDRIVEQFGKRITTYLERDLPLDANTRNRLEPRHLPLLPAARALLQAYALKIERLQAPGESLSTVTAFASKSAEQAARIAGVLTLFDSLDAQHVGCDRMANGIDLAQYYLSEAQRLADAAIIPLEIQQAETLRLWLLERWTEPLISIRAIVRLGPNTLRDAKKAKAAVGLLQQNDWLVKLDDGDFVDGVKSRTVWRIHGKR